MNVIFNAINRKWDSLIKAEESQQTWDEFYSCLKGKKLFLFGLGDGVEHLLQRTLLQHEIEGFIDNDISKHGYHFNEFISAESNVKINNPCVCCIEELGNYLKDDIVVLICSLKNGNEIAHQLKKCGISNCYFLLLLEKERYETQNVKIEDEDDTINYINEYKNSEIQKNKIVFSSMGTYSGHGKAIAEELIKRDLNLDIVWMVNDLTIEIPAQIRKVYKKNKRKYISEMMSAHIWIFDDHSLGIEYKKDGQMYIQVKHWSSITLKSFGIKLAQYLEDELRLEIYEKEIALTDYILTGSEFDTRTCREAYLYDGNIVEVGSARSDILFSDANIKKSTYQKLGLKDNVKNILYVPTFRLDKNKRLNIRNDGEVDWIKLKNALSNQFGGEWKLLYRLHPSVVGKEVALKNIEDVIDVSSYNDSQELVAASDIVITDYSSIMFEPAFVKKPVFLFAPDKDEYINGERELLISYETLPFPIAETNEELVENITSFNYEEYEQKVTQFLDFYGVHEDGHASERAADFVLNLLEKE